MKILAIILFQFLSQSLLPFVKSQCSNYPSIKNAKEIEKDGALMTDAGKEVNVECKTGYDLSGDSALTCISDESGNYSWKGRRYPQCVEHSWKILSMNQISELFQFDPLKQVIQLRFFEHLPVLPHSLMLWCNMNFYSVDATNTLVPSSHSRILFSFEDSKIVDSVVEYGIKTNDGNYSYDNRPCRFCLDFSVPEDKVPEVVTYHLPSRTYYDGVLGEGYCQKEISNEWTAVMSSGKITRFSNQCFLKNDTDLDKNDDEEAFTVWVRTLPHDSSDLFCESNPEIENIGSAKVADFPIRIGTVVTVKCNDGYNQSGSSLGTCQGFKNRYKFIIQPRCSKIVDVERTNEQESVQSNKKDQEAQVAALRRKIDSKNAGINDEANDDLPWNLTLILFFSFLMMLTYCVVLMRQLKYFKLIWSCMNLCITPCKRCIENIKRKRTYKEPSNTTKMIDKKQFSALH